jgi:protease PrsW
LETEEKRRQEMPDITFKCPECNKDLTVDEKGRDMRIACPQCGKEIDIPSVDESSHDLPNAGEIAARVTARISSAAGVERLEGFSFREMFSEVFKKHTEDEVERYFAVGGPDTTPSILEVDTTWPKPWVFFRTFVIAFLVYFSLISAWYAHNNIFLVPGIILIGSFALPFATLLFFMEANVRRNVSLYQINKLVFRGGAIGLSFSLFFFAVMGVINLPFIPSVAAIAEEPGKLLALYLIINNRKYPYILNGLLFGAAVGAGFAAFESAGYALYFGLNDKVGGAMESVIMTRGILSPFAHIAWTAMCGGALWRVKGSQSFNFSMLRDPRFLKVFIAAVMLHALWNLPIHVLPFYASYFILGAIAWVIILGLIQEGLKELRTEKATTLEKQITEATSDHE